MHVMKKPGERRERFHTLKRLYRETPVRAGIFAIRNTANGKVLLGSSLNLHGPLNRHKFILTRGMHDNKSLQSDWNKYGPDKFVFEILETVEEDRDGVALDCEDELRRLEAQWIAKIQPFGEHGYNLKPVIRQV